MERRRLAKGFTHSRLRCSRGGISNGLGCEEFAERMTLTHVLEQKLRYGRTTATAPSLLWRLEHSLQEHNNLRKELSYNNINDAAAALAYRRVRARCCSGQTHESCVGVGDSVEEAFSEPLPVIPSPSLGNCRFESTCGCSYRKMLHQIFLEIIIAPSFPLRPTDIGG